MLKQQTAFQAACVIAASRSADGCTVYVNVTIKPTWDVGYRAIVGAEITGYTVSDWYGPESIVSYTNGKQREI